MPFKSKSQQRFMFARHPKMAREWAHETKDIKSLPEKIDKEKTSAEEQTKDPQALGLGKRFLGATAGSMAIGSVGGLGTHALNKHIDRGELRQRTTPKDIERLKKSMNYRGEAIHDVKGRMGSAGYLGIDDKGVANIPRKTGPHVAAHEFGHGVLRGSRIGRGLAGARLVSPLAAGASSFMAMADPDSDVSKAAPIVAGLSTLPTLVDEAGASLKAMKGLRGAGYAVAQQALAKRQLLKMFGSYGLQAGTTIAAPLAARAVLKRMKKSKEKKAMHPVTINAFVDELNKIAQVEKTSGLPSYLKGMVRSGQGLSNVSRGVDAMGNAAQKTLMTKNLGQAAGGKLMSHVHGRMAGAAMGANPVAAQKLVRQGQRAASIGREGMQAAAPQAARLAPKPMIAAAPAMKAVG